jgi:pantoate--beta-alanine ligase
MVQLFHSVSSLRAQVSKSKADGEKIALVPTMGALHEGHLSLMRLAQEKADRVMVSIFVNPTQFGEGEDFEAYPRDLEVDRALLKEVGVDWLYVPTVKEMYPHGFATTVSVAEHLTNRLCGVHRPGHFAGVCTVVAKLLLQSQPDIAIFGEKDYQQLQIIRRMVEDLDVPVQIIGAAIQREEDGLAMSSRNVYLSAEERQLAPLLYRLLQRAASELSPRACHGVLSRGAEAAARTPSFDGVTLLELCQSIERELLESGFDSVDYVEAVDPNSLKPVSELNQPARLLVAAKLGNTRLIDNIALEPIS